MTIDTNKYLAPIHVETPSVEKDILEYFSITPETLHEFDVNIRGKIEVLVERFEFINHLEALIKFIELNKFTKNSMESIDSKNIKVTQIDIFYLMGQNISGADYDLHALVFYLLITCIDTIKGQPKYYSPFKWLGNNIEILSNKTLDELPEIINEAEKTYSEEFGLRKRFIEAFIEDISDKLSNELAENILVVKITSGKINKESLKSWNAKDEKQKLKKIADTLYEIRSTYTHASIRTFMPILPLSSAILKDGTTILYRKNTKHFLHLVREIIIDLVKTFLPQ